MSPPRPPASGQTTSDLRSLVARRVGTQRKVVLLGSDPTLLRTIESNGCTVLADPESLDAVTAFAPAVVVAFDGFAREGDGAQNFAALSKAAPGAALVFSFANAASSSALLLALTGQPPAPGLSEPQVRSWLSAAGLHIASRDVVIGPHQATGLAVDAEAQLRALLEQLNPDAAAERLLIVALPGPAPTAAALPCEPGLLTVIVSSGVDGAPLAATLAAVAAQTQRPLQVIVAGAGTQSEHPDFALEVVPVTSADFAVRTNVALPRARGQYVAFLEAGDGVERQHFRQLIQLLEQGTSAWAIARVKQPGVQATPSAFSLPHWLGAGASARCSLLLDRSRLGPFPLTFAEGIADAEPLFLARLAALFPASVATGQPTVARSIAASPGAAEALTAALRARPLRAIGLLSITVDA